MGDKEAYMLQVYEQWLNNIIRGKRSDEYLKKREFGRIIIYGMGKMGVNLFYELKDSDVDVVACVDKDADNIFYEETEVEKPDCITWDADVIVVTAVCFFDEICRNLLNITDLSVISLEDIVYEV